MKIREKKQRIGNGAGEFIIGKIDGDEMGEFRNEWGKSSGVTGGIEGELGDSVAGARQPTKKMGDVRWCARIGGKIP